MLEGCQGSICMSVCVCVCVCVCTRAHRCALVAGVERGGNVGGETGGSCVTLHTGGSISICHIMRAAILSILKRSSR
uniref:Putative secreted protein n=1 Tax=Anopheles triannulatus TaxID=58253 RepID=A0A2M4B0T9_9DIPT